jgi:NTF2 fold immunity protein
MRSVANILVVFLAAAIGCNNGNPPPSKESRLSEAQVLPIADRALKAKMAPEHVDKYKPYRAELRDGIWSVFGTLPGGGPGGTPEARVRDSDGEVLQVFHSQ